MPLLPQVQRKVGKDPLDAGNGLIRRPVLEPTLPHLAGWAQIHSTHNRVTVGATGPTPCGERSLDASSRRFFVASCAKPILTRRRGRGQRGGFAIGKTRFRNDNQLIRPAFDPDRPSNRNRAVSRVGQGPILTSFGSQAFCMFAVFLFIRFFIFRFYRRRFFCSRHSPGRSGITGTPFPWSATAWLEASCVF